MGRSILQARDLPLPTLRPIVQPVEHYCKRGGGKRGNNDDFLWVAPMILRGGGILVAMMIAKSSVSRSDGRVAGVSYSSCCQGDTDESPVASANVAGHSTENNRCYPALFQNLATATLAGKQPVATGRDCASRKLFAVQSLRTNRMVFFVAPLAEIAKIAKLICVGFEPTGSQEGSYLWETDPSAILELLDDRRRFD